MKKILVILFTLFNLGNAFNICVVGASSSLGREIIYQGLNEFNYKITGVTNSPKKVRIPYRGPGLDDKSKNELIINDNLNVINYLQNVPDYDAIIFSTGGSAFEQNDYSDKLTRKFLNNLPKKCKSISLVSAYGVGDSIKGANVGIVSMRNWYLKDVYRAKEEQEIMINEFSGNVKKFIYRPKVLSYGDKLFEATPRQDLANLILKKL